MFQHAGFLSVLAGAIALDFGHARDAILAPTALMRIEVALAAIGDLLVQACKLYLALAALDTSDRIAGGTSF